MAITPPTVKAALLALFNANTWPGNTPSIAWGGPTESDDQSRGAERVYFADVRELEESHPTLGGTRIDENYSLRMHIDVRVDGDDEQAAEIRAWALYESLRRLLWVNRNLISNPPEMVVRLENRTTSGTNVLIPSAWYSRIQVDQQVVGYVFNP